MCVRFVDSRWVVGASRVNYILVHKGHSQIYGAASKEVALQTPLPPGVTIEDRVALFVAYQPDNEVLSVHRISPDEVRAAELKPPADRKKKEPPDA
jgi:hypothetical protein